MDAKICGFGLAVKVSSILRCGQRKAENETEEDDKKTSSVPHCGFTLTGVLSAATSGDKIPVNPVYRVIPAPLAWHRKGGPPLFYLLEIPLLGAKL